MALTITTLSSTSTADDSSQQTHTSSSFTPTAGAKLYAFAVCQNAGSTAAHVWACSGGSLSWTQVAQSAMTGDATNDTSVVLFVATAAASSMTVTVDPHSATAVTTYMSLRVFEVTPGASVTTAHSAVTSVSNGGMVSGTLAGAATSGNLSIAMLGRSSDTGSPTAPSGWTEFTVQSQRWTSANVYHRSDFTGTSVTWTTPGPGFNWGCSILVELADSGPLSATATPAAIALPAVTLPTPTAGAPIVPMFLRPTRSTVIST